jgi:hypothetical protein
MTTTIIGPVLPLGEIIAWKCSGTTQARLVAALADAGLDSSIARELAPRNAFSRACRKLADQRIIRQVADDNRYLTFQFTKEAKIGEQYEYAMEAKLLLDKHTGKIECPVEALAEKARAELDAAFDARTAGDVTTIVQRIIERNGDLFAIRPQGGAYFVPQKHSGLVDQVQKFLGAIDGVVLRFAVSQGNPETERSVRESIAAGLAGLIADHRAAVDAFGADTRPETITRAAERIRTSKFKVEAYATLLGEQRANLEAELRASAAHLKAKVAEIGKATPIKSVAEAKIAAAEIAA